MFVGLEPARLELAPLLVVLDQKVACFHPTNPLAEQRKTVLLDVFDLVVCHRPRKKPTLSLTGRLALQTSESSFPDTSPQHPYP